MFNYCGSPASIHHHEVHIWYGYINLFYHATRVKLLQRYYSIFVRLSHIQLESKKEKKAYFQHLIKCDAKRVQHIYICPLEFNANTTLFELFALSEDLRHFASLIHLFSF